MINIIDVAKVIRSKNSGPFKLTIDVIFKDEEKYKFAKNSNVITPELIADLYHLSKDQIVAFTWYDQGRALKVTIPRSIPSGSPGDTDVYGCQQHAPMLKIKFPSN